MDASDASDADDASASGSGADARAPLTKSQRLTLSKWFEVAATEPLNTCLDWVARQEAETDRRFIVFAHEVAFGQDQATQKVVRQYQAIEEDAGLRQYCHENGGAERNAHEIIRFGPVCLFVDIDVSADDPFRDKAADAAAAFAEACKKAAEAQFSVVCTTYQLDASLPHGKFSRHIIMRMADATTGKECAFATVRDCAAFVFAIEAEEGYGNCLAGDKPLIDHAVYRRNGSLRTMGSTKLGQNRPLRLIGSKVVPALPNGALPVDLFRCTLVSIGPKTPDLRLIATTFLPPPQRTPSPLAGLGKRKMSETKLHDRALIDTLAAVVPTILKNDAYAAEITDFGTIRIKCNGKLCERKGAIHSSNTVYYILDAKQQYVQQHCYSAKCKTLPKSQRLRVSADVLKAASGWMDANCPRQMRTYGQGLAKTLIQPARDSGIGRAVV